VTSRTLHDARLWVQQGTKLLGEALVGLDEQGYDAPSGLPGWTRKHVVAHVAANADAVGNLVHWAATGERTPMYSSAEQRNTDIEAGATRSGAELARWFTRSAERLEAAFDALTEEQWATEVVTAQGRTVPATETPWMRAREVLVHAVDIAGGVRFADLPVDFLAALVDDIAGKRSAAAGTPAAGPALVVEPTDSDDRWLVAGDGEPVLVSGPLAAVTAYLAGRGHAGVTSPEHAVPPLPAWL
jgi:maleylpyruvate isomerase